MVGWINVALELHNGLLATVRDPSHRLVGITSHWSYTVDYRRRFGIHRIGQTREHHSYRRLVFWNRGQMTRSAPEPAPPEVSFEHGGLWTTIRFSVHQSLIHGGYFCGGRDDINWRRWNFPSSKSPSCLLTEMWKHSFRRRGSNSHYLRFWSRPLYHAATAAVW